MITIDDKKDLLLATIYLLEFDNAVILQRSLVGVDLKKLDFKKIWSIHQKALEDDDDLTETYKSQTYYNKFLKEYK